MAGVVEVGKKAVIISGELSIVRIRPEAENRVLLRRRKERKYEGTLSYIRYDLLGMFFPCGEGSRQAGGSKPSLCESFDGNYGN